MRLRPLTGDETGRGEAAVVHAHENTATVVSGPGEADVQVFAFDQVFSPEATQLEVFSKCAAPLVEQLCDRLLAGDPRELLAPPPTLRAGAPATLADVRAGETFEHAVVKNVAPFGCFVDVGVGTDGLLHSSELRAHGGTLEVEARVRVVVKSVDVERGRLGLALAPA